MSLADSQEASEPEAAPVDQRQMLQAASESAPIREVANVIMQDHVRRGRRGLALCAAASGAGVTFVSTVVAMAMAQSGVRTLVIEANLRRPSLSTLLPSPAPDEPNLVSFLTNQLDDASRVIRAEVMPDLSIIYAGAARVDAADLFDTERFEQVMQYALRTYDLTLIDTPPANRCAETRRIAAVAGYAVLVARQNVTMAEDLTTLVADLRLDRTQVIGSIFNEG